MGVAVAHEISPELGLVCPELREHALTPLPTLDPDELFAVEPALAPLPQPPRLALVEPEPSLKPNRNREPDPSHEARSSVARHCRRARGVHDRGALPRRGAGSGPDRRDRGRRVRSRALIEHPPAGVCSGRRRASSTVATRESE